MWHKALTQDGFSNEEELFSQHRKSKNGVASGWLAQTLNSSRQLSSWHLCTSPSWIPSAPGCFQDGCHSPRTHGGERGRQQRLCPSHFVLFLFLILLRGSLTEFLLITVVRVNAVYISKGVLGNRDREAGHGMWPPRTSTLRRGEEGGHSSDTSALVTGGGEGCIWA